VALVREADLVAQHARHESGYRVADHHRGDLAAREHEIARRELLVRALLQKPLVHALVVAADEDDVLIVALQLLRLLLGEHGAARREEDRVHGGRDLVADGRPAVVERVALQNRAPSAAVGVVVDLVLPVRRVVADLVGLDREQALFPRAAENAGRQHGLDGLWEKGQNVKPHRTPSPRSDARRCARRPGPPVRRTRELPE